MAFDTDIDGAKAEVWAQDVYDELNRAAEIMTKIEQECATDPGENDTIYQGMKTAAASLKTFWDNMANGFQTAITNLKGMLSKWSETVGKLGEEITELKDKIGT